MGRLSFGVLSIDPQTNPAVLDTATWDREGALETIRRAGTKYWIAARGAAQKGKLLPSETGISLAKGSLCEYRGSFYLLASLTDGQQVFVSIGAGSGESPLGKPIGAFPLGEESSVLVYPADAKLIDLFCRSILPSKGPIALGATPRLGIGVRMSTTVWPGIWPAMSGFAANAIQNSVRELSLLEDVLAGRAAHTNYLFSFGSIEEGHTGSTFEGLWTAGVLDALKSDTRPVYGADADHIQIKRGPEGLERARRVIEAARYYTFFTLDVSDILNYGALNDRDIAGEYLDHMLNAEERKTVLGYHGNKRRLGMADYQPGEKEIGSLVGKHWRALHALETLHEHIQRVKGDIPFDLELSIDENPPEFKTCDSITRETELIFLILEAQRRHIPLTHVAPNFGVEKGVDYRCPDGLKGLELRVKSLHQIAEDQGLMLDCHSGDDLSRDTRRVFGRAAGGKIHFKISPMLQMLFAETLHKLAPKAFIRWWEATKAYVERKAEAGSEFAARCLREVGTDAKPSPHDNLFHYYHFAPVGLRDASGQYMHRELFYTLSSEFYVEYQRRVEALLIEVAEDVLESK